MPDLKGFLVAQGLQHEFIEKEETHHAEHASAATGIALNDIVKTLVFIDENEKPLVAIVLADSDVSRHKLQSAANVKEAKIAPQKDAERYAGFPTGGIPPLGHKHKMPVFVDAKVADKQAIWAGGGARTKMVKLNVADVIRINDAKVADISMELRK